MWRKLSSKFRVRTPFVLLLLAAIFAGGYYFFQYVPSHSKPGQPVFVLPGYVLTYAPIEPVRETAYVLSRTLEVWDTPAVIRTRIGHLKSGDRVFVLGHFRQWAHVRLANGREGWVEKDGLISAGTHETDQRLLDRISQIPVQAVGHAVNVANVHLEPSRESPVVARLHKNGRIEIFDRRVVKRPPPAHAPGNLPVVTGVNDVWYLVRTGSRAGWMLGRLVELDVPQSIAAYAQNTNLVAWFVLNKVDDNGRQVPQYLVADREGSIKFDFTHIRVLTWWKRKQTYAIAYIEGGLRGYFPILVTHEGSIPYFRLRLVNNEGRKYQKVYALFDTITKVVGTVDDWDPDAMPERPPRKARRR